MPGYTLVPVDYQPDFDGYSLVPVDYDPFADNGPIRQAPTQPESQPDAGFHQPPSTPVPQPPGQDPHSQYQALRPMLGDRNAMLATVHPEIRQTLIAQALAGRQQPGRTSEPAPTAGVSGVTQQAQTQTQPAQPEPLSQPQQPATGAGQPNVGAPAIDAPSGSQGGNGLSPGGGDVGGGPNPASDQGGAEPLPFSGYANPSPTESLVNRQKMDDQEEVIKTDPNRGRLIDGGELYKFVTTKLPIAEYPIDGGTGWQFTANSPFYAFDGTRYGTIDANPERPVTVTIKQDGTFTISRP